MLELPEIDPATLDLDGAIIARHRCVEAVGELARYMEIGNERIVWLNGFIAAATPAGAVVDDELPVP